MRIPVNKEFFFVCLLFLYPWMNIISNRFSNIINFLLIAMLIGLAAIFRKATDRFKVDFITKFILAWLFILLISFSYKTFYFVAPFDPFYFVLTFNLIIFLGFSCLIDIRNVVDRYFLLYLNYLIILSFIAILIGYIALNSSLPDTWQLLYRSGPGLSHDYWNRPFGLFGQPSINITVIVFAYMLRLYVVDTTVKNKNKVRELSLFIIVILTVFFQQAGTGYLGLLVMLSLLLFRNGKMFLVVPALIIFILMLGFIFYDEIQSMNLLLSNKMSEEYIMASVEYFYADLIKPYLTDLNLLGFLLGINPKFNYGIDFGPLYVLYKLGIFFTLTFFCYLAVMLFIARSFSLLSAIVLILVLSLHYPVVIYPVPFCLLLLTGYFVIGKFHDARQV
jgi:hypothetical protein